MSNSLPKHYHVNLYEVLNAAAQQEIIVAARIEVYGEGEKPRTIWSTMPNVDTQMDFIYGNVLEIVSALNQNLDEILGELEHNGWVIDSEETTEQKPKPETIYRTTHFVLRWSGDAE
jgi:hypothetical protein